MKKTYVTPEIVHMFALETKDVITLSATEEQRLRDPFVSDWE